MLPQKWQAGASLWTLKEPTEPPHSLTGAAAEPVADAPPPPTAWLSEPAEDWTPIAC